MGSPGPPDDDRNLLLDEIGDRLERFRLLAGDERRRDEILSELDLRGEREIEMVRELSDRRILLPLAIGALPCLALALTPSASRSTAFEPRQEKPKDAGPNYPRVNLATSYEVDPHWPKKPSHFEWGAMPGIAVDKQDRVYAFTRAKPPVQVYDADGNFLTALGEAEIGRADFQIRMWMSSSGRSSDRRRRRLPISSGPCSSPDGSGLRRVRGSKPQPNRKIERRARRMADRAAVK